MDRFSKKKENFAFSEKKRALLALRLSQGGVASSSQPGIAPRKAGEALLLSFAQQRLWFLDQLKPGNAVYNVPLVIHLSGPLQMQGLATCLEQIIERHEILRTTFVGQQEFPVQVIASTVRLSLPLVDLSSLEPALRESRSRMLAQQEASLPFDLERGPLFRARLLRLAAREHLLFLTLHHIVTDGWSTPILLRELNTLYQAYVRGERAELPELGLQYADYALWQRQWLQGAVLQEQLGYWRRQLAQVPTLALPTDHSRPAIQTFEGAYRVFQLPISLSERLQGLSRREGVTLFMALLATFQVVLMRWSGQEDIVVGTPIANRTRPELERMIGFFVNMLALRTNLSGRPGFVEVLRRVREVCLGAYGHQDVPFEQVVEELHPERDLSRSPLFQVLFMLQNAQAERSDGALNKRARDDELHLQAWGIENNVAKFDLTLEVQESEQGLRGQIIYSRELFEPETVERLLGYWQRVLEAVVADPQQPITDLPLLTAPQLERLLRISSGAILAFPEGVSVHKLVEEQVARRPEAIALVWEEMHLSYQELNIRANKLAHLLRARGVGPEVCVGLCVERTPYMVIGLLGILKAGGAYVPLDPAYPSERLSFMLQDADVALLLTVAGLEQHFESCGREILCLDVSEEMLERQEEHNLETDLDAEHVAYIIYTSGSTGHPKGVEISHRNLQHLIHWHIQAFQLTTEDRATHLAGLGFDASGWELWPYLAQGAQLHLVDDETRVSPQRLQEWLDEQQITVSFVPTPLADELLCLDWKTSGALRLLLTGGDVLHRWPQEQIPFRLINNYGPTECCVVASSGPVAHQGALRGKPDLGRPLTNAQLYLLDKAGQLIPPGAAGELYIGGAGVGRGYHGQADLTAERFVPDPFSLEPGSRLYRTGDRMRYREDGTLEFLGRLDQQVKIRGFRIELEEIETVLMEQQGVQAAAVQAVRRLEEQEDSSDSYLVAYVVREPLASGREIRADELQEGLQRLLPVYMVPSTILFLEGLPLSEAGKLNRKALPAPGREEDLKHVDKRLARNSTERLLAEIWQQVLGVEQVGIHDDFFSLGGHSMIAVRLLYLIQQAIGKKLSLTTLFQGSTIEAQARLLVSPTELTSASSLVGIRPYGSRLPLFCVHPKGGYVFSYADLVRCLDVHYPIYGLQAKGIEREEEELHTKIEDMAAYYIDIMRDVQPEGPYHLCGYSMGGLIAFEIACQLQLQGQRVNLLCMLDCDVDNQDIEGVNDPDESIFLVNEFSRYFPLSRENLEGLDTDEQLSFILERARQANALAPLPELGLAGMRRYVEVARTHVRAAVNYHPGIYHGRVLYFSGSGEPAAMEWSRHATEGVELYTVAGEHLATMRPPHVYRIAEQLQGCLDRIGGTTIDG